jgi:hypothetical protein
MTQPAASQSLRIRLRVLRRKTQLRRARLRAQLFAWRLVLLTAFGRPLELWVGDSHSSHLNNSDWPIPALRKVAKGRYVWHLGPRLMFSIARDDLPADVLRTARRMGRYGRPGVVRWIFVFGEIDIRCHLAPRLRAKDEPLGFPARYVEHAVNAATTAKARDIIITVPVPPSDDVQDAEGFPIAGTLAERLVAFTRMQAELTAAVAAPVLLLDVTDGLADHTGELRREMSFDGCHVNEVGRTVVRRRLDTIESN